jgi:hypothetical protein
MRPDAVAKRDAALKPLWDLEDAGRSGTPVFQAARHAIAAIERLLEADDGGDSPAETGIAWKYLGDAYWTLREVDGCDALDRARQAYLAGEAYLKGPGAELPLAKLNFNLANTLRLLDGGQNRASLLEARARYLEALRLFQRAKPDAVETVLESLRQLEIALQMLGFLERSHDELARGRALQERLRHAGASHDPNLDREVTAEIARMKQAEETDRAGLAEFLRSTKPFAGDTAGWSGLGALNEMMRAETAGPVPLRIDSAYSKDFDAAYSMIEQAMQTGEVSAERGDALQRALEQFQGIMERPAHTPEELTAQSIRMREHLNRVRGVASDPKSGVSTVEAFLYDQLNRPGLGELEHKTIWDFLVECGHIKFSLSKATTESEVREVKRNRIRPLVHGVRQVALRHHIMLAEPFWGWAPVNANPARVFYAGSPFLRPIVGERCADRGLELVRLTSQWGAGQTRWNLMRSCGLAVFDLRSEARDHWPSVCHALGIALALSVQPVIVGDRDTSLPFDIDVATPVTQDDLGEGLDAALLALPQTEGRSALHDTVQEALARSHHTDASTMLLKQSLAAGKAADVLQVGASLAMLAERNGDGTWALLHPVWPGSYPSPLDRRCFHIMPFADGFNDVRDHVRRACKGASIDYTRADEVFEPNVIRTIWNEICRATHVVVDLSGVNANVCLELALAQSIGRPLMIVARQEGRTARIDGLFPEIAKLQIRGYESNDQLAAMVRGFVTQRTG